MNTHGNMYGTNFECAFVPNFERITMTLPTGSGLNTELGVEKQIMFGKVEKIPMLGDINCLSSKNDKAVEVTHYRSYFLVPEINKRTNRQRDQIIEPHVVIRPSLKASKIKPQICEKFQRIVVETKNL